MTPSDATTYAELGRILRDARLSHGVEPEQAARVLYIRARYIEALEEGAFTELPGATYVKGYLIQYAGFLGLNGEEVLAAYERIGAVQPRRFFHIPDTITKEDRPPHLLVAVTLGLAIAVIGTLHMAFSPPRPAINAPARLITDASPSAGTAAEAIRVPACLEAMPDDAWPPCYYRPLPRSRFVRGKPYDLP